MKGDVVAATPTDQTARWTPAAVEAAPADSDGAGPAGPDGTAGQADQSGFEDRWRAVGDKSGRKGGFASGLVAGVTWALLAGLFGLVVAGVAVPRALGGLALTVLSGSMEPTFYPGDRIVTEAVAPDEVEVGDVISYLPKPDDPELVTHRVVGVGYSKATGKVFHLRGDANTAEDPPVLGKQIRFRYLYRIPWLGWGAEKVGGNAGLLVCVFAVALIGYGVVEIARPADKDGRRSSKRPRPEPGAPDVPTG
ncbi:MAG: signal peptidase I [Propionibacteriaceae bacterium]|jgi:signal peptidase|nr:signal peptidase I [Propionibacteriaceae bacterium]